MASRWTLAGGNWISSESLRVRTKGAVAFLADTMVAQLGKQVGQKTLNFLCPLRGGQYSVFREVARIGPCGAASFAFHHLVGANVIVSVTII